VTIDGGLHACPHGCLPPGLPLYANGELQGVPYADAGSYEFLVEASIGFNDGGGLVVFQNVLLTVERDAGAGQ
jgi:hypothetical protein